MQNSQEYDKAIARKFDYPAYTEIPIVKKLLKSSSTIPYENSNTQVNGGSYNLHLYC